MNPQITTYIYMTKKNYAKPSLKVVMLQNSDLIATSGDSPRTVALGLDLEDNDYGTAE